VTDPLIVLRKLITLREHLSRARARRPQTANALAADTLVQDALSMSLLVAIQEAIDVAFHIVVDEAWGMPSSYAEAFGILADHGVIERDLVPKLEGTARFRNRLAHGYASVDVERLWAELPDGIATLERFVAAIARFVQPSDATST
jgi:uncharacterized protein YutE (UPF0331/DUF86 family)